VTWKIVTTDIKDAPTRAPVQGEYKGGNVLHPYGTIAWEEHLEAWNAYQAKYHAEQSAERIAERGGFGYSELQALLGRIPSTWKAI
jgi:hypothetical protein